LYFVLLSLFRWSDIWFNPLLSLTVIWLNVQDAETYEVLFLHQFFFCRRLNTATNSQGGGGVLGIWVV